MSGQPGQMQADHKYDFLLQRIDAQKVMIERLTERLTQAEKENAVAHSVLDTLKAEVERLKALVVELGGNPEPISPLTQSAEAESSAAG